jgi:hypothetical protein
MIFTGFGPGCSRGPCARSLRCTRCGVARRRQGPQGPRLHPDRSGRRGWLIAIRLLVLFAQIIPATAQELTLTTDSEANFRRFIHMAQTGQLGADVTNANIAMDGARVRLELVRHDAPSKVFVLEPRRTHPGHSRFFEITLAERATSDDLERVGRALDQCFQADPFQFAGLEESLAEEPMQGFGAAWTYGGWRGVARAFERRMMSLASLEYTVAVMVVLVAGFAASLALLWSAHPRRMT